MSHGFAKIPQAFSICETRVVSTPASNQQYTLYKAVKKVYADLDDLLLIYGLDAAHEGLAKLKIHWVKPKGSHPEVELRRGIDASNLTKVINLASDKGTPEGRLRASQDMRALTREGMQKVGIDHCVIENGRLVPVDKDGKQFKKLSFELSDNHEVTLAVLGNTHPFFERMRLLNGDNFYAEVATIAHRRVRTLATNHQIAGYLEFLIEGMMERQPELEKTGYIEAFFLFVLGDGFSGDRRQLIMHILGKAEQPPEFLFEDLLAGIGRVATDMVIAPNHSERLFSKADLRALDPFWEGSVRLSVMAEAIEKAERESKDE